MTPQPKSFYAQLPAKRMAAGALILNAQQDILLVEPTYKPYWEIPGGLVEVGESPQHACQREIMEELGLQLPIGRLLCIDYTSETEARTESLQFIFSVSLPQTYQIHLQSQELLSWGFYPLEAAQKKTHPQLAQRLENALSASISNQTFYLEDQKKA